MSKKRMLALVLAAVMSLSSATVALADGESTAPETETTTSTDETGGKQPGDEGNDLTETETGEQGPANVLGAAPESEPVQTTPNSSTPFMVNGQSYETLAKAIDDVPNGVETTITLTNSITEESAVTIPEGKNIVLDLGGFEYTLSGKDSISTGIDQNITTDVYALLNQGTLSVKSGSIIISNEASSFVNFGTLNIEDDASISSHNNTLVNYGGSVTTSGDISTDSAENTLVTFGGNVEIEGGNITANNDNAAALTIFSRNYDQKSDGADVVISGGTLTGGAYVASTNNLYSGYSNLTITGGTLTGGYATIFWPSFGKVIIGGTQEGEPNISTDNGSAVMICSGTLEVLGGTLNGSASEGYTTAELVQQYRQYSGAANQGDAITVIANRGKGYDGAPLSVTISGGTFNGENNYAVRYIDCNTENTPLEQDVQVSISGGVFSGDLGPIDASFVPEENQKFISGGEFADNVSEYTEDNIAAVTRSRSGADTYFYGDSTESIEVEEDDEITVTALPAGEEINLISDSDVEVTIVNKTGDPIRVNGVEIEEGGNGETIKVPASTTNPPSHNPGGSSDNDNSDYFGNETWDEVKDQIAEAEEGDTIKVSATGLPSFPSSVARALKGKDITLEIRKNGVTYEVNGLEIGDIDKIWYEFDELETELLTADADTDSEAPAAEDEDKTNPDTGR